MAAGENSDSATRMKSAASLLVKGGTLINEPCQKCGGVQVRFKDRTVCINCGNEMVPAAENTETDKVKSGSASDLDQAASILEKKITELAKRIESEDDIGVQMRQTELLGNFLIALGKIRDLATRKS